jgi:hypothetical protein
MKKIIVLAIVMVAGLSACQGSATIGSPAPEKVTVTETTTAAPTPTPTPPPTKEAPSRVDNPDPSGYLSYVHNAGGTSAMYMTRSLGLQIGYNVCKALDRGVGFTQLVAAVSDNGVDPRTKSALIAGAPEYLCQSHLAQLHAWSNQRA